MNENLELMDQFFLVSRLMHRNHFYKNRLAHKESFRGQGRVLSILSHHPGIHQKDLSNLLDIRAQSLGEMIMKLERNGYITRLPNDKDRRAMCIHLTAEGIQAATFMESNIQEAVKIFDCLNPEEKTTLHQYLSRIIKETENLQCTGNGADE
ncbi:MAG: MarR family transcriptional regulator [Clostridia bacterium]|nr:MarR family transcriptional regulator [Clostridia bacterium]